MSSKLSTFNFNYQNKDYTFSVNPAGELIPHNSLKGEALAEAQSVIPIARQKFQEVLRPLNTVITVSDKHYQKFIKAGEALENVEKLRNSTLKNVEIRLNKYLKEFQMLRRSPSEESINKLTLLSNKLKTLSEKRRNNVENKMGFLGKFFHKLAQVFRGGGWKTLAKRTDELRKKVDILISSEKVRLKKFEFETEQHILMEVSKDTEFGRELKSNAIEKLNRLDENQFKEMMTCFMPRPNITPASFAHIYPGLSAEKKESFNKIVLAHPDWHALADYHFFVDGIPVEGFAVDHYLEKFEQEFQQNFSKLKPDDSSRVHLACELGFERKIKSTPKTYFNKCMQYLFVKKVESLVEVEKPNWGKLIQLFEAIKIPIDFVVDGMINYYDEQSKLTLHSAINETNLNAQIVQKIKDNINYQSFGLFPTPAAQ